jgi:hypothetical protein
MDAIREITMNATAKHTHTNPHNVMGDPVSARGSSGTASLSSARLTFADEAAASASSEAIE